MPKCLIHLLHCDQVSDRKELSLRILLGEFSYSVDVCVHTISSSESRDVSFQQIRTPASPFPPVDTVAAPCGSPAVLHLRQYYGVVRLLPDPSALPPVDPRLHVPPDPFRRVEETRCTLDFPWLYPPFPASCPFRSIMAHRGLPPHRTPPCRFPAAGSSSGFPTSPPGSSPDSGQIVGRVLGT